MKLARWIGIAFAAPVVLYLIAMAVTPPTRFTTRVEVDRPVEVVWRVFTDPSRLGEWLEGFRSIETVQGEPNAPGSRHRLVFEEDGHLMEFEELVLAVDPGRELAFRMIHPMMESDVAVRFEELGGRTAIVTRNEVRGRGLIRPLIPLMKSGMQDRQLEGYERLAALIAREPELGPDAAEAEPGAD